MTCYVIFTEEIDAQILCPFASYIFLVFAPYIIFAFLLFLTFVCLFVSSFFSFARLLKEMITYRFPHRHLFVCLFVISLLIILNNYASSLLKNIDVFFVYGYAKIHAAGQFFTTHDFALIPWSSALTREDSFRNKRKALKSEPATTTFTGWKEDIRY